MPTPHPLDTATALTSDGDGWAARPSPDYANMVGPCGGVTAALLLAAAEQRAMPGAEPVSVTVHYCAQIADAPLQLSCRELRAGRTVQHLSVEMAQDGAVVAAATVLMALRRDTWAHQPARMPAVPRAADVPRYAPVQHPAWLDRYEFRFVEGELRIGDTPRAEPAPARSVLWLRDDPPRPLDHRSLLALSDAFFVRLFHVRGARTPAGTVSMTTQFHAGAEDLARQADRPLLGVADASVFRRNFFDQPSQLWSDDGTLLATSTQMGWYKA